MRKRTIWASALAAATLTIGLAAPTASAAPVASAAATTQADQLIAQLPAMRAQAEATRARLGLEESPLRSALLDVIDPTQYDCPTATPPVVAAISAGIADWTADQRLAALYVILFDIPMTEAAYLTTPGPYTFGATGTYTKKAVGTFRDLRKFWDIKSWDIQLVPAHGRMLLDTARVTKVFTTIYGQAPDVSLNTANFIAGQVNSAALGFGNSPLFTFNAYANSSEGVPTPGIGLVPDRIIVGDGVLDGFAQVGLADVAPQAIIGHEFGHHIQYEDGLFKSDLPAPEATRRTELMADSFSAYFLTHARGENMSFRRVSHFVQMFAQLGDCGFDSPSHHGTPNQRVRAALWGWGVAETARHQGRILPSRLFAARFERVLPYLVRPDATDAQITADATAAGQAA